MNSIDWHQLPGEPARWYARFSIYLDLGPKRTLEAAFQQARGLEQLAGERPGSNWYRAAELYNWRERAAAYDQVERERIRALERERRFDAREHRLSLIDRLLDTVTNMLTLALPNNLTPDEARAALPQLRTMFKDLIHAQRIELGPPTDEAATADIEITADDLAEAERIARMHNQHERIDPA